MTGLYSVNQIKKSHRPRSVRLMKGMTRRNKHVLEKHKIVVLHNDTWKRWNDLRHYLNLETNSKVADVLLDTWFTRAESFDHSDMDVKDDIPAINVSNHSENEAELGYFSHGLYKVSSGEEDALVKTEVQYNDDLPGHNGQTSDAPGHVSEPSSQGTVQDDSDGTEDLEQFTINEMIAAVCDDEINNEKGNNRISKRVKGRGFEPNDASMDWNENVEHAEEKSYDPDIKVEMEQPNLEDHNDMYLENLDNGVISVVRSDCDTKLILKRNKRKSTSSVSASLDFELEENEIKDVTSEITYSGLSLDENIDKKIKQTKKRSKKRKSENDDIPGVTKLKKKKKTEKKTKEEKVEIKQKPWVHIRLEDHPEKFRMECVGSFERKNRNSNIVEELYTCLQCGRFKSTAKDIFEEHIEKHVNRVLECSRCSYVGRSEIEVMRHKMKHGHMLKGQEYMCDLCGIVLYSWDSRLSHLGKVHHDPRFKCKYCGGKFETRLKRQQHSRRVHADVSQYCNICKADFQTSTAEEFKEHQAQCKPGHPCQVCGVVLASKNGLNNHLKATHMGVRKYQCHLCQYAGKSAQRLREHIMTHTSVHPYSCDKCTFTCVQACQLKSHQRTHTGDKPYKCTQCNFAAAWNVQLKDHLKVHCLETAVYCQPCNILFKNDKAMKMHEKKDHCYI